MHNTRDLIAQARAALVPLPPSPPGECPIKLDTFVVGLSFECQRTDAHDVHEHTSDRGHARWTACANGSSDVHEMRLG